MLRDPYEVLGLRPGATAEEVRAAHRRIASRIHPDRFAELGGPYPEHFDDLLKRVNAARDLLLDPTSRAAFDGASGPRSEEARRETAGGREEKEAKGAGSRRANRGDAAAERIREAIEQELAAEERARATRERMRSGQGGLAARLAYGAAPAVSRVAMIAAAAWAYLLVAEGTGAATASGGASSRIAFAALWLLAPLVAWRVRARWGRRTARSSWPHARRWPGVAPYNRAWAARTSLESIALGPPVVLLCAMVPGGTLALAAAGALSACLGAAWLAALLTRPRGRP